MRGAVYTLLEGRENRLKEQFKAERGYTKMTPKRQLEFAEVVDADEGIRFYREIRDALA